jgi:hypothetical protein
MELRAKIDEKAMEIAACFPSCAGQTIDVLDVNTYPP